MVALEEIGCAYEVELVAFMAGQHRTATFLGLNPKGKVPVLVVDGQPLSENSAILTWLSRTYPEARLLPLGQGDFEDARVIADLAFCASGLHPIVTRLRIPKFFCDIPGSERRVYELAESAIRLNFDALEERLQRGPWWYGERWSIIDAYINWIWFRVIGTGFEGADYPLLTAHNNAIAERPSVQRMLQQNAKAAESLSARGLTMQFDNIGAVAAAAENTQK